MILFPKNVMDMLRTHAYDKPPHFMVPVTIPLSDDACQNCGGSGYVVVQWVKSGPHQYPLGVNTVATWYEHEPEGWYTFNAQKYPCPVCRSVADVAAAQVSGTGLQPGEAAALDLDWFARQNGKRQIAARVKMMMGSEKPTGILTFHGGYGTGKSSILKLLTAHYAERGLRVYYTRAEDILSEIKATFGRNVEQTEAGIKRMMADYDFLAIDEVDRITNSESGWSRANMMCILDERYRLREWKCTALATNARPEEMTGDFAYLASRIKDGQVIPVGGDDLRGVKR